MSAADRFRISDFGLRIGRTGNPHSAIRIPQSAGFTLLELLVALTILVTAFAIIWGTFSATITAWRRGGELQDELKHGDFVMEQLVSALRSAAFFHTAPSKYGFRLKSSSGGYPEDRLSWVTASTAFMPPDDPLANSLHRLVVDIEENEDGDSAVAIRALPHLADMEEDDVDPWFVSTEVKGISCRVYDLETESWEGEWEDTNSVPSLLEITLYMDPLEQYGEPVKIERLVEIPIAPALTNAVTDEGSSTNKVR
ncbi:MAG: prepilin-type N-terminal cleavage/methylation domain-containing protein [Verrucomicrobiota bacterium]